MGARGMIFDRLGRELRDLRISITDRCNFRCAFCMPEGQDFEFFRRCLLYTSDAADEGLGLPWEVQKASL